MSAEPIAQPFVLNPETVRILCRALTEIADLTRPGLNDQCRENAHKVAIACLWQIEADLRKQMDGGEA